MDGPSRLNLTQFGTLAKQANQPDGGFTVDARTGKAATSGWVVAQKGHEAKLPAPTSASDLQAYHAEHHAGLMAAGHLGAWHAEDGPHVTLDATKIHPDTTEGFLKAGRAMHTQHQDAIYNLGTDETYHSTSSRTVNGVGDLTDNHPKKARSNRKIHTAWAQRRLTERGYPTPPGGWPRT